MAGRRLTSQDRCPQGLILLNPQELRKTLFTRVEGGLVARAKRVVSSRSDEHCLNGGDCKVHFASKRHRRRQPAPRPTNSFSPINVVSGPLYFC